MTVFFSENSRFPFLSSKTNTSKLPSVHGIADKEDAIKSLLRKWKRSVVKDGILSTLLGT